MSKRIAILFPGDMGAALGERLIENGYEVFTCVEDRGERTSENARRVKFQIAKSLEETVNSANLIVSLVPPTEALGVAKRVASVLDNKIPRYYLDANSISPASVKEVEKALSESDIMFTDGVFLGSATMLKDKTTLVISGPSPDVVQNALQDSVRVSVIGDAIGDASSLKMCFSGFNKSLVALFIEIMAAAQRSGQQNEVLGYLREFYPETIDTIERLLTSYPRQRFRRRDEMREVARFIESVDIISPISEGAGQIFERLCAVQLTSSNYDSEQKLIEEMLMAEAYLRGKGK